MWCESTASSGHDSSVLNVCEGKIFSLYWSREQPEATWLLFVTAPEGKIVSYKRNNNTRLQVYTTSSLSSVQFSVRTASVVRMQ